MAKVRIRLDCTIEMPGHGIPRGLPERVELVLPRKGGRKREVG